MRTLAGSIPSSGLVTVAGPGAFPCVKSSPLLLMRSHAQQAAVAFRLRADWEPSFRAWDRGRRAFPVIGGVAGDGGCRGNRAPAYREEGRAPNAVLPPPPPSPSSDSALPVGMWSHSRAFCGTQLADLCMRISAAPPSVPGTL